MNASLSDVADLLKGGSARPSLFFNPPASFRGLTLASFSGTERISAPFQYDLDVRLDPGHPPLESLGPSLVNQEVTFGLNFGPGARRPFHGVIRSVSSYLGREGHSLHLAVGPRLCLLAFRSGYRGFEGLSKPEIVRTVLRDAGVEHVELRLRRPHAAIEYVAMHDETEFNFVSRLLESEGIAYHFIHSECKHTLVLTDDDAGFLEKSPTRVVELRGISGPDDPGVGIDSWQCRWASRPASHAVDGRDPLHADRDLSARLAAKGPGRVAGSESFRWCGRLADREAARAALRNDAEGDEASAGEAVGSGCVPWFGAGQTMLLDAGGGPRGYLLTSVSHSASEGGGGSPASYENSFACLNQPASHRPARRTPTPRIAGAVTAKVVGPEGPAGAATHADDHGRVRIQYYWDRRTATGEPGSCWARLNQGWCGPKGTGAMAIPLVGQEVILTYEEGNPDHPVVMGAVYNSLQTPPYAASGSRPTLGLRIPSYGDASGGRVTELKIEAEDGRERLSIVTPGEMSTDARGTVRDRAGAGRHIATQGERRESVGGVAAFTYAKDLVMHVVKSLKIKVQGDCIQRIGGDFAVQAGSIRLGGSKSIEIVAPGGFKVIGPGGAFIEMTPSGAFRLGGNPVMINCEGAKPRESSCPEVADAASPDFPANA